MVWPAFPGQENLNQLISKELILTSYWPGRATLRRVFVTIAIGAIGGTLLTLLGVPAAWTSGAMVAVAIAALARVEVGLPVEMSNGLFVILGVSMGSGVSPEVVERIGHWPGTMAALVLVVLLVGLATYAYLRGVARWDSETAYFGAIPGALSYVMALATERRVDLPRIAASQSIRLLILVAVLPFLITATAPPSAHEHLPAVLPGAGEFAVLFLLCLLASIVAVRIGVPGGWLTGAFFTSSALNATGIIPVVLPEPVLVCCYICLGCFVGSRLGATTLDVFFAMIRAGLGAIGVALIVSGGMALLVSRAFDIPFGQLMLAYAPGGLEVMTLLAFMLDMDPAFVAAHQLVRFIGMILVLPLITRLVLGPKPLPD